MSINLSFWSINVSKDHCQVANVFAFGLFADDVLSFF